MYLLISVFNMAWSPLLSCFLFTCEFSYFTSEVPGAWFPFSLQRVHGQIVFDSAHFLACLILMLLNEDSQLEAFQNMQTVGIQGLNSGAVWPADMNS